MDFFEKDPTPENYWRGVILFGNNFATYKFALAQALCEVKRENSLVKLENLALPFSAHICAHLKEAPKQILNIKRPGQFILACQQFNEQAITHGQLIEATVRHGFNVVLSAFHNVSGGPVAKPFFINEPRAHKAIRLTDDFYRLTESAQFANLTQETDARWRLVEKAWQMNLPPQLLDVHYDAEQETLFTRLSSSRITLTSCRNSLNGYQKGHCFYCNAPISLEKHDATLADVDHFLPLAAQLPGINLNGVWNLVLACRSCNRGENGKSARVPTLTLLARLHARNEYFINSRLPLHEAIINQTGNNERLRKTFLQDAWSAAFANRLQQWEPALQQELIF